MTVIPIYTIKVSPFTDTRKSNEGGEKVTLLTQARVDMFRFFKKLFRTFDPKLKIHDSTAPYRLKIEILSAGFRRSEAEAFEKDTYDYAWHGEEDYLSLSDQEVFRVGVGTLRYLYGEGPTFQMEKFRQQTQHIKLTDFRDLLRSVWPEIEF